MCYEDIKKVLFKPLKTFSALKMIDLLLQNFDKKILFCIPPPFFATSPPPFCERLLYYNHKVGGYGKPISPSKR